MENVVKKRTQSVTDERFEDGEESNSDSSNEDDISKDPMIKMKKAQTRPAEAGGGTNGRTKGKGKAVKKK